MPGEPRWSRYKPRAWAEIDGTMVEAVAVSVDFELNAIPRAQVYLPVGRSVQSGKASPIHAIVRGLTEQKPIKIYLQMTPHRQSDGGIAGLGLPDGPFQIFDGLTAGGSYARSTSGAMYVIAANHWLVRMNQASAFSDSSHPGNPSQYSYGALQPNSGDTGGRHWTVLSQADKHVNSGTLNGDVWGQALYPWFQELVSRDGFWVRERNLKGDGTNAQARAALERLAPGCACYQALALKGNLTVDVDIARQVANDVALLTFNPEAIVHQTLWDILVGKFSNAYLFAVVPRVSDALVVPYIPCYRGGGKAFAEVKASEYVSIDLQSEMPRPLRAYGIQSTLQTRNGTLSETPGGTIMGLGGWFDADKDGAVIVGGAPGWMGGILSGSKYAAEAAGGDLRPIRNAANPDAGNANNAGALAKGRAEGKIKSLLDAYAQARYAQEVLKGRWGALSGAIRTDIAPGSLVRIEGAGEKFIAGDAFGMPYLAEVLRVSFQVNGESATGGTSFHLGNVRTEQENGDDKTSVAEHPLYQSTFKGCKLL